MPEDKNATVYEVFREAVDEYSDHKGDDLLTDPAAVASSPRKSPGTGCHYPRPKPKSSTRKTGLFHSRAFSANGDRSE